MYIVNTTFVVDPGAHDRWIDLMRNEYIPLLRAGGFAEITFTRVVTGDAQPHHTYSVQVGAADMAQYRRLAGELFDHYLQRADPLFGAQVCFFTTLLKKVDI